MTKERFKAKLWLSAVHGVLILIVFAFVYTSAAVARNLQLQHNLSSIAFVPIGLISAGVLYALFRLRSTVDSRNLVQRVVWSIFISGVAIALLSFYSVQLVDTYPL